MMWHRLIHIAWIVFGFEIKNGETSCLTWCMEGENLKLICRVDNFSDYISITDPQEKQQAHCDLSMTIPRCISNGSIKVNSSTKDIELVLKNVQSNMINGLWTCNQRQNSSSTVVSTENGIIDASKVDISVDELNSNSSKIAKIRCNSCRVPRGNHVEFLINNVTVDSIIHNRHSGQCTHINGECKPEMCTCSSNGREFTRMIELKTDNLTVSCEMTFSDKTKISFFTVTAYMHYNGKKFTRMDSTVKVTKKPEGTGSKEDTDGIIPDRDKEPKENATVTEESTEKDVQWKVIAVVFIIAVSVFVIVIVIYFICRKFTERLQDTNGDDDRRYEDNKRKSANKQRYGTIEFHNEDSEGIAKCFLDVLYEEINEDNQKCAVADRKSEEVTDEKESTSVKNGSSDENDNKQRYGTTEFHNEDSEVTDVLYEDINKDDHKYAVADRKAEVDIKNEEPHKMNTIAAVTDERNTTVIVNASYGFIAEVTDEKESTSVKNGSSYENAAETRQECSKKESPVDHVSGDERQPLLMNGTYHETGDRQKRDDLRVRKNIDYMVEETGEDKEAADNVIYLLNCCVRNIHKEASFRIDSMTTTSSGELLVCYIDSKRVLKFDEDFVYIKTIETHHEPYDIAVIPGSKRAVTTCHQAPFLQVLDIEGSKILKTKLVNKDSADSGIFCTNINIIVGGRKQIYLYSHEISLEKTISIKGSEGVIRSLCCANEIICLIEQGSTTVKFVTLFGETENTYEPNLFNFPTKAIVGKNNDIFILDRVAKKIHHLSARGEFIQVIDPVKCDITSPITICFSRDCTKLYVSNESGLNLRI